MPPKKALNDVSRSGTPSPARAVTPVDADAAGFSPEGDDILGRLQALTEGAAPSVFAGPVQASGEDVDDVGTSVSWGRPQWPRGFPRTSAVVFRGACGRSKTRCPGS
ncbi:hypothetical protein MTO96_030070 [Rhipicephalus appendiculatus]